MGNKQITIRRLLFVGLCLLVMREGILAQFVSDHHTSSTVFLSENELIQTEQFFLTSPEGNDLSIPGIEGGQQDNSSDITHRKSPILAAGLSLLLPGLGEYYVGDQIWRGVIFTALEAGLWFGNIHFNSRGDDSLAAFQAWADSLWLPSKYAETLNDILSDVHRDFRITDPNNFTQINMAEDTINATNISPLPLSHRLPERGSQQYYELISKYIQFTSGWRDAIDNIPEHSAFYMRHADMRANMNNQYDIANTFIYGMILNRILSAIDAALLARDHNSSIRLSGELHQEQRPDGRLGFVSTAKLSVRF